MKALLFCAAVGLGAVPVNAAIVNVDFQNPDTFGTPGSVYGNQLYCETVALCFGSNGFNYQISWYGVPGLSLDDEGLAESFVYRADGERFSVTSIFVSAATYGAHPQWGRPHIAGDGPPPEGSFFDLEYDAWAYSREYDGKLFGVYGLRDGFVAYSYEFPILPGASFSDPDMHLKLNFNDIDALHLAIILPENARNFAFYDHEPLHPGDIWCGDYCANFAISKMQVADGLARIPLPTTLPLLVGGLGVMAAARRFWAHRPPT